jgi:hypothetical protein
VRTEEEKAAFLSKRIEFRTAIKRLVEDQKASKGEFREAKKIHVLDREESLLNRKRAGIMQTRSVIRHTLLAYAMFRGKPYLTIEQKTTEPVQAYNIWVVFRSLGLEAKYDKEGIEMWLSGKIPDFRIDIHTDGSVTTKFTDYKIPESVFHGGVT